MTNQDDLAELDPEVIRVIKEVRSVWERTQSKWLSSKLRSKYPEESDDLESQIKVALAHLDNRRWDEALSAAQSALEIEEEIGSGRFWRDFVLQMEEATETAQS